MTIAATRYSLMVSSSTLPPVVLSPDDLRHRQVSRLHMLRCRIRVVQTRRNDGLRTEYRIVEVTEHLPRYTQLSIGESLALLPPVPFAPGVRPDSAESGHADERT